MTRPAKQTFVPSGKDQAQFPVFFARNGSVTLAALKMGAIGSFGAWGVEFSSRDTEYMAASSRGRLRRGTGRMSDRARGHGSYREAQLPASPAAARAPRAATLPPRRLQAQFERLVAIP